MSYHHEGTALKKLFYNNLKLGPAGLSRAAGRNIGWANKILERETFSREEAQTVKNYLLSKGVPRQEIAYLLRNGREGVKPIPGDFDHVKEWHLSRSHRRPQEKRKKESLYSRAKNRKQKQEEESEPE